MVQNIHVDGVPLCGASQSFLGAAIMIFLVLGVFLAITGHFINKNKPKTSKKPLLGHLGAALVVFAVLGAIIYVAAPLLIKVLLGSSMNPSDPCNGAISPSGIPPYCGEYCQNGSVPKSAENCTCLVYEIAPL